MSILRFRCHRCARVNEIDLALTDDDELQASCARCGRMHSDDEIRLTPVAAEAASMTTSEDDDDTRRPAEHDG
jgi:hypothetical protein